MPSLLPKRIAQSEKCNFICPLQVPCSNEVENNLGLTVLDEPCINQSDPALLKLKLKAISKDVKQNEYEDVMHNTSVKCTADTRQIESWIENIRHLHESTARPDSVKLIHNHQRLDIDELMQEWHEEVETAINVHSIPKADLDCSLEEYINILCGEKKSAQCNRLPITLNNSFSGILDIPVQSNKICSLHLLFSLYNEFQNSQVSLQHFSRIAFVRHWAFLMDMIHSL